MITWLDLYHVLTAVVPLYVAMILAYGSVKWWKIFSPDQCSGINRFVALFAVPLLSFHFISTNNPYEMNYHFIAADTLQKLIVLGLLFIWSWFCKGGSLEWSITLFSLSTLPNTLVMGIPLLKGMYGDASGTLMVQIVVLQCIIWYTLMLFLFEYRGARLLISEQFPETAGSIVSLKVDSDIISLDGKEPLETEAQLGEDGKLHVKVRKSTSSRSEVFSRNSHGISLTPRPSNMTNAEIYSLQSSRNQTPRGSSFNHTDFYSFVNGKTGVSPRTSNFGALGFDEEIGGTNYGVRGGGGGYPAPPLTYWQGVLVFLAAKSRMIKTAEVAADIQNFIICVEMLIAACGHFFAFPYKEYAGANIGVSSGLSGSLAHALKLNDFYHDTVHQFAPTYHDYVLYNHSDGEEGPRKYRSRTFVPTGQEMDAVRKNKHMYGNKLDDNSSQSSSGLSSPENPVASRTSNPEKMSSSLLVDTTNSMSVPYDMTLIDLDLSSYPSNVPQVDDNAKR